MDNRPKRLAISIGGFTGPSFSIELSGGRLRYVAYEYAYASPREEVITPTAEQWSVFRTALDSIGVWQWQNDYPSKGAICDGSQRAFAVAYEDVELHTGGDNAYPGDEADDDTLSSAEPSARFERFLKAVSDLIGGRDFQ